MRQILGARRIRLYCRNGIALDWANTVLRLALFGEPATTTRLLTSAVTRTT